MKVNVSEFEPTAIKLCWAQIGDVVQLVAEKPYELGYHLVALKEGHEGHDVGAYSTGGLYRYGDRVKLVNLNTGAIISPRSLSMRVMVRAATATIGGPLGQGAKPTKPCRCSDKNEDHGP